MFLMWQIYSLLPSPLGTPSRKAGVRFELTHTGFAVRAIRLFLVSGHEADAEGIEPSSV